MTQQSGNQFDDDLTVGWDNDGSFSTDSIDLFEFTGDEESPIARLKSIILSIDWEINDDILRQLEDELVDLSDIWADDKIKQIYIQGLSKIGKYIYKERANANPNSIKLLITFYHNLEKIVSSDDLMSEDEKKQLLVDDVKKFDQLKAQINRSASKNDVAAAPTPTADSVSGDVQQLKELKARVLGIDWEINDIELQKLSDEVQRLEGIFTHNRAKLILLQGIGALSSYINKMRSKSNSKAFTLLHSFYGVLETISSSELSGKDEKHLLLSEVDKFKAFKTEISQSQLETKDAPQNDPSPAGESVSPNSTDIQSSSREVLPVDGSIDEVVVATDVDDRLESVFGDIEDDMGEGGIDESAALEGVNVETEADDDSDEDALPYEDGTVAPALAEVDEESSFSVEKLAGDLAESEEAVVHEEVAVFDDVLQGVDVETEADDESDEEKLPYEYGNVAPALSGSFDEGGFDGESVVTPNDDSDSEDLDNRLDSFFDDEVQTSSDEWSAEQQDVSEELIETGGDPAKGEIVTALSDVGEEDLEPDEDKIVAALSDVAGEDLDLDEEEIVATLSDVVEDDLEPVLEEPGMVFDKEDSIDQDDLEPVLSEADEQIFTEDVLEPRIKNDRTFFDEGENFTPELDDVAAASISENIFEEEVTEDHLSFLDEEIPDPESTETIEKFFNSDVEKALSFTDPDEELIPLLSDDPAMLEDTGDGQNKDIAASFFEEPEELENTVTEESDDSDEIQFTVPGEIAAEEDLDSNVIKESSLDDVIEFKVPGEEDSVDAPLLFATAEDAESTEVVFEAVGDDVEVDSLPGEEYVDLVDSGLDDYGEVVFLEAQYSGYSTEDFQEIGGFIGLLKAGITVDNVQNILTEINSLRGSSASNYTVKIFLQLLSTVCQNIEKMPPDSIAAGLKIMEEVFTGLESCVSSEVSAGKIQEQLLSCTSQVLLMQQRDFVQAQTQAIIETESHGVPEEEMSSAGEAIEEEPVLFEDSSGSDTQLKSFVHEEFADLRKIFLEEITTIRKEFLDK